jgi:uncharacterized protein YneF (UPF0154 family)
MRVLLVLIGAGLLAGLLAGAFIVDLFRELQNVIP